MRLTYKRTWGRCLPGCGSWSRASRYVNRLVVPSAGPSERGRFDRCRWRFGRTSRGWLCDGRSRCISRSRWEGRYKRYHRREDDGGNHESGNYSLCAIHIVHHLLWCL